MSNKPLQLKAASREIIRGKQHGSFFALTIPLEHKNGYAFLLVDLDKSATQGPRIIALLREAAERLARTLTETSHLQHRFEQVLQAINNDLSELGEQDPKLHPRALNMMIGVLREETFILSGGGMIHARFLRKTQKGTYKVYDLAHNVASESGGPKLSQFFSTVLDGTLQADDVLFIASRDLHRLLRVDEVQSLLATLPPASALETIEQYLPARGQLSMLLFQARKEKEVLTGYGKTVSTAASMQALTGTEQETTNLIGLEKPHVHQSFMRLVSQVKAGNPSAARETAQLIGAKAWQLTKVAGMYLLHILTNIGLSIAGAFRALTKRGSKRQRELSTVKSAWSRTFNSGQKRFSKLPRGGKAALIASVGILILFVVVLVGARSRQHIVQQQEAFTEQLALAQERIAAAEASAIYRDYPAAVRALQEAEIALNALDVSKGNREEEVAAVRELLAQQQRVVRKEQAPDITLLPVVNQLIVGTNGEIVFYQDGNAGRIDDDEIVATRIIRDEGFSPVHLTTYNDDVIFTDANGVVYRYRATTGTIAAVGINAAENEIAGATDLMQYGERLYILAAEQNQLYRHQLIEDQDYGPATPWLNSDQTVTSATSITVDGAIWLGGAGSLRKFEQGQEVSLPSPLIDPSLGAITDIWTDQDIETIYVLDAQQQRVLVLNKETMELVTQYVDPQLAQATRLYIDTPTRNAFVSLPTSILRFPIAETL